MTEDEIRIIVKNEIIKRNKLAKQSLKSHAKKFVDLYAKNIIINAVNDNLNEVTNQSLRRHERISELVKLNTRQMQQNQIGLANVYEQFKEITGGTYITSLQEKLKEIDIKLETIKEVETLLEDLAEKMHTVYHIYNLKDIDEDKIELISKIAKLFEDHY